MRGKGCAVYGRAEPPETSQEPTLRLYTAGAGMSALRELLGLRNRHLTLAAPWQVFALTIDPHTYTPSHGPQDWTNAPPVVVQIVRTISLLREDRERATHFSFNIWIYTARGAWCWNIAFRKGQRRFGAEPRYRNDGVGGLEVDEYWAALQQAMRPTPNRDGNAGGSVSDD